MGVFVRNSRRHCFRAHWDHDHFVGHFRLSDLVQGVICIGETLCHTYGSHGYRMDVSLAVGHIWRGLAAGAFQYCLIHCCRVGTGECLHRAIWQTELKLTTLRVAAEEWHFSPLVAALGTLLRAPFGVIFIGCDWLLVACLHRRAQ